MGLTIYGTAASRAARPLWVATELGLVYNHIATPNLGGATRTAKFLAINPNHRMPAIIDHEPLGGGPPISVFESGAILMYLAEKSGQLWPQTPREKYEVAQWVLWQMACWKKAALLPASFQKC